MAGFRPRTPPPPPPPPPPPRPMPQADSRDICIPVSGGSYVTAQGDMCMARSNFTGTISVSTDSQGRRTVREVGRRVIKEEIKKEVTEDPPALPPFTSLVRRSRSPPPRPPLPRSGVSRTPLPPPPRWVSPQPQRPETPPPPYQGIIVTEAPRSPSPYGEVKVEQLPIGVLGN